MTDNLLRLADAAQLLVDIIPDKKSHRSWVSYLKANPEKYLKQHGYKIPVSVVNGELFYREASLRAFAIIMGDSSARREITGKLRAVDKFSLKKSKNKHLKSDNKNWSWAVKKK